MQIVVLTSSPNRDGASNTLAGAFVAGTREAGHTVRVFDLARMNFVPCTGCYAGQARQRCVLDDDFAQVEAALETAGMIVYVTPVYYYLMTAPLKAAVDRLHCFSPKLNGKKSLLIATAWRKDEGVMQYLSAWYQGLAEYLEYDNQGMILARGCGDVDTVKSSTYWAQAHRFGKNL